MFKAYVPQSFVEGFYRGEGRFNNMKIKSKGYFNVTASKFHRTIFLLSVNSIDLYFRTADINLVSRTEGDIVSVNGKEYVKLTKFDVSPQFGDLKVFATGLFPDPELST